MLKKPCPYVDGVFLVHQACSSHFGLDLIMELTRH
jgi:hypothetical protein